MVSRRRFFIALGANAFAVPFASFAQQKGKVWRVGFLSQRTRPASLDSDFYGGFPRGMRELGYVEGENVIFEWRFAGGNSGNLGDLAMELARLKVDVIVTAGTPATVAAQKATAIIPIVMGTVADPVGSGLVASLARPGGNITGLSNLARDLRPKHLEMLRGCIANTVNGRSSNQRSDDGSCIAGGYANNECKDTAFGGTHLAGNSRRVRHDGTRGCRCGNCFA